MMIYLDILDIDDFYDYLDNNKLSHDLVLRTKCGFVTECIKYLLNFDGEYKIYDNFHIENNYLFDNFDTKYAYEFVIDVMDKAVFAEKERSKSVIDHQFVVLNYKNNWYIIDAYIERREFMYNILNPLKLTKFVQDIRNNFEIDKWNNLFNVHIQRPDLKIGVTSIYQHTWHNSKNTKLKFIKLIEKSEHRLNHEPKGTNPKYLFLLNKDLNKNSAQKYLNKLKKLVTGFPKEPEN